MPSVHVTQLFNRVSWPIRITFPHFFVSFELQKDINLNTYYYGSKNKKYDLLYNDDGHDFTAYGPRKQPTSDYPCR